jgi:glycosyltransferase involved in cell wall biosynthesis
MNILELNFEKSWRGGERQTIYNIHGLLSKSIKVGLVCRKGFRLEEEAKKTPCFVAAFNNVFQVFWFLCTAAKNYDVLHAQTSHILTYCLLSKPFHRKRIVFSRRVDFKPSGALTKWKYLNTDCIVAVSNGVKNTIEAFCGREDIEVITDVAVKKETNTLDAETLRQQFNIPPSKLIIGSIAALDKHKDPLTLIEAIKTLKQKCNDFVVLHFGNGPLFDVCRKKIEEHQLSDTYFLVGFKDNVEQYFSLFNVFVLTSIEEGLGSSVLDAFLYKVPVVSTRAGGLKELVGEGRGIACNIQSPNEVASAIHHALSENEEAKQRRTNNAFDYVVAQHSMEAITHQYLTIFRRFAVSSS